MVGRDLGHAEQTLSWDELDAIGVTPDEAFALGLRNAAAIMTGATQFTGIAIPGARVLVAVSNEFFLGAALIESREHAIAGTPQIVAPISWHHWVLYGLEPDATRETLAAIRRLATQVADSITTIGNAYAWLSRTPWSWPGGAELPIVLAETTALPPELAQVLDRPAPAV